jgi:hypothetical protein
MLTVHQLTREAIPGALHDLDGQVFARFGIDGTAQYLLRPDGHIGYRSGGTDRSCRQPKISTRSSTSHRTVPTHRSA